MGCNSSKDVMARIKKQEAKIDALIKINQELERKLAELPTTGSDGKHANETATDMTSLKTTIDTRFNKLEKTVEKIHTELRLKLFEGVIDNLDDKNVNKDQQDSLSLNFEKENAHPHKKAEDAPWKDLLNDSNLTAQKMIDRINYQDIAAESNLMNGVINSKKHAEYRGKENVNYKVEMNYNNGNMPVINGRRRSSNLREY